MNPFRKRFCSKPRAVKGVLDHKNTRAYVIEGWGAELDSIPPKAKRGVDGMDGMEDDREKASKPG